MIENYRVLGAELRNWGRWGEDDRLGTLNLVSAERRAAAARLVRSGRVFDLALSIGPTGIPPRAGSPRPRPIHVMLRTASPAWPDGMVGTDDLAVIPLQGSTQWDGLGHCGYDDFFYNGVAASTVTAAGSSVYSLHQLAVAGVVGRGVLLDVARLHRTEILAADTAIGPEDLSAAARAQGVTIQGGDILLVRTGWLGHWTRHGDAEAVWAGEPGLTPECARWLHERDVAAVMVDNFGVELIPANPGFGAAWPLHCIAIRDMGMTLGELVVLDELAGDCASDGVWEFLLVASPLKVEQSVGSPITPLAIK